MEHQSKIYDNLSPSILMVDDNPKNLQILGNVLMQENYSLEYAMNGKIALDWVRKKDFDLILLDVIMPEMGGFEFCKIFKSDIKHKNIPIIFLTAQKELKSILEGFEIGGVDYINKPFNRQELLARVSTHIELKKSRDIIIQNALEFEDKNKQIQSSLFYSEKIQNAVLKSVDKSLDLLREHFLLYIPKDTVGGDFYWTYEENDKVFIAIMDCTGHGIPGALISMLGVTFLNEIVISEKISEPGEILNRLRKRVINAFGQTGSMAEIHDGLDGAIISIDKKKNTLLFSGAFSSLYLFRNEEMIILKGDKMPIGHYELLESFSSADITLKKDDVIYLYTDGYPDQFGGKRNSKLKIKAFRELLFSIHKEPMTNQKEFLIQHFMEWKGEQDQVDDITVLGIKI